MSDYFADEIDAMRANARYRIAVIMTRVTYLSFFGWLPVGFVGLFLVPRSAVDHVLLTYFVVMMITGFASTAVQISAGVPLPYTYPDLRRVFRDDMLRLHWWSGPPPALAARQYQ
jgi:hypothetical protein